MKRTASHMLLVVIGVVLVLSASSSVVFAATRCECVGYVVNKLFGGPRPGNWPTAASMATPDYWGNPKVVGTKLRIRSSTASTGDVIIMQPNAPIEIYNSQTKRWNRLSNIGDGRGHIGFVQSAQYNNQGGYWLITMRSANWPDQGQFTDSNCSNVVDSQIRVYNGDATSLWREKR